MTAGADPNPEPPHEEGISLDQLAQAFAQVMGTAPRLNQGEPSQPQAETVSPAGQTPSVDGCAAEEPIPSAAAPAQDDDTCPINPRSILEAMLFVGDREDRPLPAARAAELMRGVQPSEIPSLVDELNRRYAAAGCPYTILDQADGYRLSLKRPYFGVRDRFYGRIRQARLSQAAVDVLAIVAYQQPLTAEQISKMRGKPSSHVLSQLVHRGLLRIERKPGKRSVAQYSTTDRFLHLFGMQTLADLPQSEELDRP